MKYNVIFLVGPQGSGKGTQAKALVEKLGFFHWEMGAVLRQNRDWKFKDGTTLGELIDNGVLLSDEQLLEVFEAKMGTIPADKGVIFDGIPRRRGQAEFLMKTLKAQGRTSFVTIYLDIPKEESIKRLVLRGQIEHRTDDTPEAIERRLKMFHENTIPMLDYLREQTIFLDVDGTPSIPEVTKIIMEAMEIEYQS